MILVTSAESCAAAVARAASRARFDSWVFHVQKVDPPIEPRVESLLSSASSLNRAAIFADRRRVASRRVASSGRIRKQGERMAEKIESLQRKRKRERERERKGEDEDIRRANRRY